MSSAASNIGSQAGPFGFGGAAGQNSDAYGNFPSFNASDAARTNFANGFFVGSQRGNLNWSGLSQTGPTGNFTALSYDSTQFGYNTKTAGGMPVTFFAGFNAQKYGDGIGSSLAPLTSGASPGYGAFAGVEFKPTSNLSLSFGAGFTQQDLKSHGQRYQIKHAARRVAGIERAAALISA